MSTVVNKIENILTSEYSTANYVELMQEIFDTMKLVAPNNFRPEFSNFSNHIKGSIHVGNYVTPDRKKIAIFAVQLKKETYVENSRSTQRSYAKKLIEGGNCDAAIVAFFMEGELKWRLSFVRLDYEMKIENGKLKQTENLTPAKRYSFLVGKNEPCHTAIDRFRQFIISQNYNPTLDDLEEAFSVEKVTDEFFNLYCEKFHQLREQLEAIEDFRIEAEQHNFTSAQFAKKLMGQIVFLYFLQKKGWLGVGAWPNTLTEKEYKNAYYARGAKSRELIPIVYRPAGDGTYHVSGAGLQSISDADEEVLAQCVKGKPWGTGPHNFMRRLFEISEKRNNNFYNDILEPLFYDALNRNRGEQGYCPALHCRIPFLSGGLFEPIDGYDWEHNQFDIPNEVFSNASTKGRDADGILDIFDRYNFTMSEDEPMEREVAIDPEMLGKVFENLLEVNDRKSKGAFYTPREIVHYMCQESLINYLCSTVSGVEESDIRDFILYGDFIKDEDTLKTLPVKDSSGKTHMEFDFNKDMKISENILSFKKKVNRLKEIDDALKNVRVADPAVGSGAFPLGMLNEIVRARQNISAYMAITMKPYDVRMMYQFERSPHTLKYETIRNCIFAADIEPSAVDIAQLRLWLALVIDDEINPNAQTDLDGHRNPLPLPNLESNILCGNSLVDVFEGVRLIKESDLLGNTSTYQLDFESSRFDSIVKQLIEKQDALFRCDDTNKKHKLTEEIKALRNMIIMNQLEYSPADMKERFLDTQKMASKPYVLWQLDFARVFREKGGFDIVIGNPPYVGEKGNKEIFRAIAEASLGKRFQRGKMDLFYYFFHLGLDLAKNSGVVSFITTNYYITATAGYNLRKDFHDRADIVEMINFNECKIFESALGQHNMITSIRKGHTNTVARVAYTNNSGFNTETVNAILSRTDKNTQFYEATQEELFDGENYYIRFKSTDNSCAEKIHQKMLLGTPLGNICHINLGCHCVLSKITNKHIKVYGDSFAVNEGVYVLSLDEAKKFDSAEAHEKRRIKPFIKNSNISRYGMEFAKMKFIYLRWEDDINSFPMIKEHLERYKQLRLDQVESYGEKTWPWYAIHRPREEFLFEEGPKIVLPYRSKRNIFGYTEEEVYASGDVFYILLNDSGKESVDIKYLLGLLNSELYYFWLYTKGKRKGNILEMYWQPLTEIPICIASQEEQNAVVDLVEQIIATNNPAEIKTLEEKINSLVYSIYGLNDDEIASVKEIYANAE